MHIASMVIAAAMSSVVSIVGVGVVEAHQAQPVRHVTLPTKPCKFEDSNNCYWDAGFMGSGGGHSYWVWKRNGKVCVRYFAAKYNQHHGHCFKP